MPEIRNFTPLLDSLVNTYGPITAAVWGRVWRYEQMPGGKCTASKEKLAEGLGVKLRTVQRHIEVLIQDGYIEDLTPDVRNKPHELRTTDKARVTVIVEATDGGMTDSHTAGMTESQGRYDLKSQEESIKKEKIEKKSKAPSGALDAPPPPDPLLPSIEPAIQVFAELNKDRDAKGRSPVLKYGSLSQKQQTEAALFKISQAGEVNKAIAWALRNERTSRSAMCNAMIAWANNLGKAPPSKNGHHAAPPSNPFLETLKAKQERTP